MKDVPDNHAAWRRLTVDVARAELEAAEGIRETALEDAVGAFIVTDVLLPGFAPVSAAAIVWRGKLASLLLSDSVCRLSPSACTWFINGTVVNAFSCWRRNYLKRLSAGAEASGVTDDSTEWKSTGASTAQVSAQGLSARCFDGLPLLLATSEDIAILNGEELADRVLAVFHQLGMTVLTN